MCIYLTTEDNITVIHKPEPGADAHKQNKSQVQIKATDNTFRMVNITGLGRTTN
jgi:hypothetical protein